MDKINHLTSKWCVMKQLVQALKPLEEETQELSAEQRVSCSKVIPLLNAILLKLRKYVVDEDETQVPDDDDDETQVLGMVMPHLWGTSPGRFTNTV